MRYLSTIIARLILYSQLILLAPMVSPVIYDKLAIYTLPRTYIATIDTPTYTNNRTKAILENFNILGDSKAVKFGPIDAGRPISIYEMDENNILYKLLFPDSIGMTHTYLDKCIIYLKKGQNPVTYRETVIHEFLHCMNYKHSPAVNDVMFKADNKENKEASIKRYAKELESKYGR